MFCCCYYKHNQQTSQLASQTYIVKYIHTVNQPDPCILSGSKATHPSFQSELVSLIVLQVGDNLSSPCYHFDLPINLTNYHSFTQYTDLLTIINQRSMRSTSPPICTHCQSTKSPLWRRGSRQEVLCNACGLYWKHHGTYRPLSLKIAADRKNENESKSTGIISGNSMQNGQNGNYYYNNNGYNGNSGNSGKGSQRRASVSSYPSHSSSTESNRHYDKLVPQ